MVVVSSLSNSHKSISILNSSLPVYFFILFFNILLLLLHSFPLPLEIGARDLKIATLPPLPLNQDLFSLLLYGKMKGFPPTAVAVVAPPPPFSEFAPSCDGYKLGFINHPSQTEQSTKCMCATSRRRNGETVACVPFAHTRRGKTYFFTYAPLAFLYRRWGW